MQKKTQNTADIYWDKY